MAIKIANEEKYRKEIREYFDSILYGRLMQLPLYSGSDEELLSYIVNYDSQLDDFNNACSWLEIGEIEEKPNPCTGGTFKVINLVTNDGCFIQINFSQFIYPMSKYERSHDITPNYDRTKANYVCTVDGKTINPKDFFYINKGQRLLYLYCIDCVTSFDNEKKCYFFAMKNISVEDIKQYIRIAQINALKDVLGDPAKNAPGTTINDNINQVLLEQDDITSSETERVVDDVFDNEYRMIFESKLKEIESSEI